MTVILQAIILDHNPKGESDLLVTAFTQEKGKINAKAKGARKSEAKLRGILEVGNEVKLMLAPGKNQIHIAGGDIIDSHILIRQNLELLLLWQAMLEVVSFATVPDNIEYEVYDLLTGWAKFLQHNLKPYSVRNKLIVYLVIWQFLSLIGFKPQFDECVRSGQKLVAENCFFSVTEGGVVSKKYFQTSDLPLSLNVWKILRYIFKGNFWAALSDIYRFRITKQENLELANILINYTENTIEKKINSLSYLEKIYTYGNKVMAGNK